MELFTDKAPHFAPGGSGRTYPEAPCIILSSDESAVADDERHGDRPALLERLRSEAFAVLRGLPGAARVAVARQDAVIVTRFQQSELLLEEEGIRLNPNGRVLTPGDTMTADEVRWAFAHHATHAAAAAVVAAYAAVVNRARSEDPGPELLWAALAHMRRVREVGEPAPGPAQFPAADGLRIATVSEVVYVNSRAQSTEFSPGMYLLVPAEFPGRCVLSVGPVFAWASAAGGDGPHFIASPSATVAGAWRRYNELCAAKLPATLALVEGPLAGSARADDITSAALPYFLHGCEACRFLGFTTGGFSNGRIDLYFCTRRPAPSLVARYGHLPHLQLEHEYHQLAGGHVEQPQEPFVVALRLARRAGLTAPFDGHLGVAHDLTDVGGSLDEVEAVVREMLRSCRARPRDVFVLADAGLAARARVLLEGRAGGEEFSAAYRHRRRRGPALFLPSSRYHGCSGEIAGAYDELTFCVVVKGVGVCRVGADEFTTEDEEVGGLTELLAGDGRPRLFARA